MQSQVILGKADVEEASTILADWLGREDPDVQTAVDGGDLGRPITAAGIRATWGNLSSWLLTNRSRTLVEQHTCLAKLGGVPCGHIEVNVMQAIDRDHNPINAFCGASPFAVLGNIVVASGSRGMGIGTSMLRQAVSFAFALPSRPLRVVLLVKEGYERARKFSRAAGFIDTELSVEKAGSVFRLIQAEAVSLVEDQDAERLATWLSAEDPAVLLAVDGGDFGRPISAAGISERWSGFVRHCRTERARDALVHRAFAAKVGGTACGHVEIAVMRSIDTGHNPVNAFCGLEPFALLLYIYIIPARRGLGLGTTMVRLACEEALRAGAARVVLIVKEDNLGARRFYARVGFKDTGVNVQKAGATFLLITLAGGQDSGDGRGC